MRTALWRPLALLFVLGSMPSWSARAEPLPDTIWLKSSTLTFNSRNDFAVQDGRIWVKPRAQKRDAWKLLGPEGLPFGEADANVRPLRIVEISADAAGLAAISENSRIFDAEVAEADQGRIHWHARWGFPLRMMAAPAFLPTARRAWAYSLLNHEAAYSEDIDGNPHTIFGVDTVFALSEDGRLIRYNDPWLPPNAFSRGISSPARGSSCVVSLSAGGSTLLVMDTTGAVYTRLVDFDALGGNPGIAYSYARRVRRYEAEGLTAQLRGRLPFLLDVRSLPWESWKAQPAIKGRFTSRVTIVQTGKGNAARELRVEGVDQANAGGYFHKPIHGGAWAFAATGDAPSGRFIDPAAPEACPVVPEEVAAGQAAIAGRKGLLSGRAELRGFSRAAEPAIVRVLAAGRAVDLSLYVQEDSFAADPAAPAVLPGAVLAGAADAARLGIEPATEVWVQVSAEAVTIESRASVSPLPHAMHMHFARPRSAPQR